MEMISNIGGYSLAAMVGVSAAFLVWLRYIKRGPVYKGKAQLVGKTVLITGGNSGVGKATAIELAKRRARVIIACRNESKALEALEEIKSISGNDMVHFMKLDLSNFQSVREFAEEVIKTEPRLDILINNAAIVTTDITKSGLELMVVTNQLGPFLLTHLLMPLIKKTAETKPVRIVNVASIAYKMGNIDFDNLGPPVDNSSMLQLIIRYANTKLMNIYFSSELNKRLRADNPQSNNITVYALHPGTIGSNLASGHALKRSRFSTWFRTTFMLLFSRSPFYGCQTTLYCCLEEGIEHMSGKFFENMKEEKLLQHARDPVVGEKLWKMCEELTGIAS